MHALPVAAMAALFLSATTATAEVTANVGFLSDYIFRGIPQSESAATAGIDFSQGGLYLGSWAADVGQGAEVDVYGGYGWEVGRFTAAIGATGYFYTDDFDDTYQEINLNIGYDWIGLQHNVGSYENFAGPTRDYRFTALSLAFSGAFATFGTFGDDFSGEYIEAGYGFELSGFDLSVAWVHSDADLALAGGRSDNSLVFAIGKSFTLHGGAGE